MEVSKPSEVFIFWEKDCKTISNVLHFNELVKVKQQLYLLNTYQPLIETIIL